MALELVPKLVQDLKKVREKFNPHLHQYGGVCLLEIPRGVIPVAYSRVVEILNMTLTDEAKNKSREILLAVLLKNLNIPVIY